MRDSDSLELLENENVTEFISLAGEYCTFLENTNNFTKTDFVKKSLNLFSGLYFYALKLPRLHDVDVPPPEKFVSELDWNSLYDKVKSKLGYHDDYLDVYDPVSKEEGEVSIVSLADNFADIYQDLKDFSTAYGMGNDELMLSAYWELIYNFEEYWGIKLLNALRAIHRLFYSDEDLEEEQEESNNEQNQQGNWLFEQKRKQSKNRNE